MTSPYAEIVHIEPRQRAEILFAIMLALFLSALDQTIVGTALPRVVSDLQGNDYYTWVVTAYLLTATVSGPIYGKLSDLYGRRPMILIGVGLFLLGSALSGLSQEMWQLIAARGLQGLGAGAIFPIALAVIGDLFSPAERGKYQGLFGAVFGIAFLIGPAIGGFLTDQISWHWVFFVNIPLGLVSMVIIWRLLPAVKHPEAVRSIDYLGAVVFASAIVPILIGLTNAQTADWTDPLVGGLIVLGMVLLAAFVWVESRARDPLIPLSLFRNRTIAVSLGTVFLASFGFFSAVIFLPRWFQVVNGSSATESGYEILPLLAGLILSSILSGQIIARTGRYRWLVIGALALMSVGLFLMTGLTADTPLPQLWVWMFIAGVGIGPTLAAFTVIIQNAAPVPQLGVATSSMAFFRQIGGTVGLAIAGSVFGSAIIRELPGQLVQAGVPAEVVDRFASSGISSGDLSGLGDLGAEILARVPESVRPLVEPLIPAIVDGFHHAFSLAVGTSIVAGVVAAVAATLLTAGLLPELPLRRHVSALEVAEAAGEPEALPVPVEEPEAF